MTPVEHMVAIVVGILLPIQVARSARPVAAQAQRSDTLPRGQLYRINAIVLVALALVVVGAALMAGESAETLGLVAPRASSLGLVFTLLAALLAVSVLDTWWRLGDRRRRAQTIDQLRTSLRIAPRDRAEYRAFVVLAVAASVAEELIFRGFLVSYVIRLLGGWVLATPVGVVVPAVPFGAAHWYQGSRSALRIGLIGAFYGLVFVVAGSILPIIAAHLAMDLAGGWLAMRLGGAPSTLAA